MSGVDLFVTFHKATTGLTVEGARREILHAHAYPVGTCRGPGYDADQGIVWTMARLEVPSAPLKSIFVMSDRPFLTVGTVGTSST